MNLAIENSMISPVIRCSTKRRLRPMGFRAHSFAKSPFSPSSALSSAPPAMRRDGCRLNVEREDVMRAIGRMTGGEKATMGFRVAWGFLS
jgi:hypothetical protein